MEESRPKPEGGLQPESSPAPQQHESEEREKTVAEKVSGGPAAEAQDDPGANGSGAPEAETGSGGGSGEPRGAIEESTSLQEAIAERDRAIADRDQAIAEKKELLERFQRAQAELDNFRKRLQRDAEELRQYAAMSTIESLLPIVDDFERALQAEGLDPKFREGFELIYRRIFDVLSRAGLKPIDTESAHFDPNLHHAVDRAPAENDEQDQKILEVYQQGYFFKERLLRPSMVKVAVKE